MKLGKKEMAKRISEYKDLYKGKTLFFTEDGNCFTSKSPAIDHARKSGIKWMEVAPEGKSANLHTELKEDSEKGKNLAEGDVSDGIPGASSEEGNDDLQDSTEKSE